jgi:adenosine kinase
MDHLMTFPGRFADSLVVEQLDKISLSFLVEDLQIRRGGIAPNICFGLAALGHDPLLVGAVGEDFAEYRSWLDRHGVQTWPVHVSQTAHTARFVCTTDADHAQIASFYTGAMAEARQIELAPIVAKAGGVDLVVISPNDPEGMHRHTDECRARGYPFVADPSQQVAWMNGPEVQRLIRGATYLFSNEYEDHLISQKTGWTHEQILQQVQYRVITRGRDGATVETADGLHLSVPIAPETVKADPTGVGDAFRAGFLAGLAWGLGLERCAQVGSLLSSYVIAVVGPQEYRFTGSFLPRFADAFGPEAAADLAPHLDHVRL